MSDLTQQLRNGFPLAVPNLVPIGTVLPYAGLTLPDGFEWCGGAELARTTNQEVFKVIGGLYGLTYSIPTNEFTVVSGSTTVTASVSAPSVGSWVCFGGANSGFNFTLPPGATNRNQVPLYVQSRPTSTTCTLSRTESGAPLVASVTASIGYMPINFLLPDLRGRVIAGRDDLGGFGSAGRLTTATDGFNANGEGLGIASGSQNHVLQLTQIPAHTHTVGGGQNTVQRTNTGANTAGVGGGSTGSAGSGLGHNNVQPTLILNYIIRIK